MDFTISPGLPVLNEVISLLQESYGQITHQQVIIYLNINDKTISN